MIEKKVSPPRAVAWTSISLLEWQRQCVTQAGGDPATVPDEPYRFLRLTEVMTRTGLSRSSVYRKIADGTFPEPLVLGPQTLAA